MAPSFTLLTVQLFIASIALTLAQQLRNQDMTIKVNLINHQPCHYQSGVDSWRRKIEFEAGGRGRGPDLVPRRGYPGCYTIGGKVTVYEDIRGELSAYIEVRNKGKRDAVPYRCINAGSDGCDEGIGSCLYCYPCRSVEQRFGSQTQLLVDGRPMRCGERLNRGTYNNVQLSFCLPQLDEIIRAQGLTRDNFLQLLQTEDGRNLRSIGLFVNVYLFDKNVSQQMATQRRIERVYRSKERMIFREEGLDPNVYWTLPFNRMIRERRQFISCHTINANIRIKYRNSG